MKKIMLRALHEKDCRKRNQNNTVNASVTRIGNIGGILARTTNAGSVFYGYDGGGNVVTLTNNAGAEVGSYTYNAWGNTVATSGVAASAPYRFSLIGVNFHQ